MGMINIRPWIQHTGLIVCDPLEFVPALFRVYRNQFLSISLEYVGNIGTPADARIVGRFLFSIPCHPILFPSMFDTNELFLRSRTMSHGEEFRYNNKECVLSHFHTGTYVTQLKGSEIENGKNST